MHPDQAAETVWQLAEALRKQEIEEQIAQVKLELCDNIQQMGLQVDRNTHEKMHGIEVSVRLSREEYAKALDLLCAELRIEPGAIERMRAFALALEELCRELTKEENIVLLREYSGFEPGPTGNKPSRADMLMEMEGELLDLEPMTGWCRLQEPQAPEGQRIKKQKIKIPDLKKIPVGVAIEDRKQLIREQTRRDYCKSESEVEEDIRRRRAHWISGAAGRRMGASSQSEQKIRRRAGETDDAPQRSGQGITDNGKEGNREEEKEPTERIYDRGQSQGQGRIRQMTQNEKAEPEKQMTQGEFSDESPQRSGTGGGEAEVDTQAEQQSSSQVAPAEPVQGESPGGESEPEAGSTDATHKEQLEQADVAAIEKKRQERGSTSAKKPRKGRQSIQETEAAALPPELPGVEIQQTDEEAVSSAPSDWEPIPAVQLLPVQAPAKPGVADDDLPIGSAEEEINRIRQEIARIRKRGE